MNFNTVYSEDSVYPDQEDFTKVWEQSYQITQDIESLINIDSLMED